MLDFLLKFIPKDYSWQVALKKVAYGLGKLALAGLAYTHSVDIQTKLGLQVDPVKFQDGVTAFAFGGLEAAHDWLKMKLPNVKWL